jgi:hypothetical protein
MRKHRERKPETIFYTPSRVKKGDISHFNCIWLVSIELIETIDNYEIEIILN